MICCSYSHPYPNSLSPFPLPTPSPSQVVGLDPSDKKITLDDGSELTYDKCLLATGGRPKNLPVFEEGSPELREHVSLYRTVSFYSHWTYHKNYSLPPSLSHFPHSFPFLLYLPSSPTLSSPLPTSPFSSFTYSDP